MCALLVASAALPADAPAAEPKPPPNPGVLWQQYPLGSDRLTGTTPTRTAPSRKGATEITDGTSGSSGLTFAPIAVGVVAALLALVGLATLLARSRRVAHPEVALAVPLATITLAAPLATITLAATRLERRRRARGHEDRLSAGDMFTSTRERRAAMTDQLDERGVSEVPRPSEVRRSHTDVGSRVADIIKAAEELSEQIRSDAQGEAAQIRRQAEESRAAAMRDVAGEQAALRTAAEAQAAEIQRTGESYATGRRREAEAEAARLIGEAEGQARAMREAAEQMSMRIETTALERREELVQGARVVEGRLHRFQKGLREISKDLEELLEPDRASSETILEALDVDQRSLSGRNAEGEQPLG